MVFIEVEQIFEQDITMKVMIRLDLITEYYPSYISNCTTIVRFNEPPIDIKESYSDFTVRISKIPLVREMNGY